MKPRSIAVISVFMLLFACLTLAVAGVPRTISYQGYLKDTAGTPVSGKVLMAFSLYTSADPLTAPVWSETEKQVDVTNGIYNTRIGSETEPIKAAFDVPYYLGITIEGQQLPLQELSSVPYAQRSAVADKINGITTVMISDGAVTSQKLAYPLGIGTTTPEFTLDVKGTGRFESNLDIASATAQIGFNRNSTNGNIYDPAHYAWQIGPTAASGDNFIFSLWRPDKSLVSNPLTLHANGNTTISGTLSVGSLAANTVTTPALANKSVTAAKMGEVCADGDVLRYDSQKNIWTCNPVTGGFPSAPPFVGAVTIEGITSSRLSSETTPDQYLDVLLYGFDIKFTYSVGTTPLLSMASVKIICDPKQFAPRLNQAIASIDQFSGVGIWIPGTGGTYGRYLYLEDVFIEGQKPIPPTRQGDRTLTEYTLVAFKATFTSPFNPAQSSVVNLLSKTVTGCTHAVPLVFTLTHGMPVDMSDLGTPVYPITTYTTMTNRPAVRASFDDLVVSGALGNDGPCLLADLNGRTFSSMMIYTAGVEKSDTPARILETRLRLDQTIYLTSYRLYAATSGTVQQEIGYSASKIYWGYYPYDPLTGANGTLVETGWNIEANTPL